MNTHFLQNPDWSEQQKNILNSEPNIVVTGCAGSGKTLLACHIAIRHSIDKKVGILVYTKALRTFIRDYLDSFGDNNIEVLYEHQWGVNAFRNFEIIIVDEFQDFSIKSIKNVISCALQGVYIFGDKEQKIYCQNLQGERTLDIEDLLSLTLFKHLRLDENFRISEENTKFISLLYNSHSLIDAGSKFNTGTKPKIERFEDVINELDWIKEFLLNNKEFCNIGILLTQNDKPGDKGKGYYEHNNQVRNDTPYGIMDFYYYLKKNKINASYKYENIDNLDFSKDVNINIMTYHSAKGLQFDCLILPFSNYGNTINEFHLNLNGTDFPSNLLYVGLTRVTQQIIITYSGSIADTYTKTIKKSYHKSKPYKPKAYETFEGTIVLNRFYY